MSTEIFVVRTLARQPIDIVDSVWSTNEKAKSRIDKLLKENPTFMWKIEMRYLDFE